MKNKLTGKAREHFYNWYEDNAHISKFNKTRNLTILHFIAQSESCQNALIIEFFDSIRYEGKPFFEFCFSFWWHNKLKHQSFNDVCAQSITKANEIFNLNNK